MTPDEIDPAAEKVKRMQLIHNERTKLSAAWHNSLSIACFAGGIVAIPLAISSSTDKHWAVTLGLVLIALIVVANGLYLQRKAAEILGHLL